MLQVRPATLDDTEAIVSVTASGWRERYQEIVPPERLADLPVERWRHEISVGLRRPVDDAFTQVAELGGKFVGYSYVMAPGRDGDLTPTAAEIVGMYVAPAHWREGIGTALLDATVERLRELEYEEAVLWVFKENRAARRFYNRHGFKADGSERFHPLAEAQAIRMHRPVGHFPGGGS
jgi:ribosomal protein S18 acetylase RimI-like enzyme